MSKYHKRALSRNNIGLPKFGSAASRIPDKSPCPIGLTAGGRVVFLRTHRPVATCNLLARLAGIGQEAIAE